MKHSELVEAIIEILDTRGWTRGVSEDDQGRVCVGRAICLVPGVMTVQPADVYYAISPTLAIPDWNDSHSDYAPIRERLVEVAKQYRNEGK